MKRPSPKWKNFVLGERCSAMCVSRIEFRAACVSRAGDSSQGSGCQSSGQGGVRRLWLRTHELSGADNVVDDHVALQVKHEPLLIVHMLVVQG